MGLEGDNVLGPVHDSTVRIDGTFNDLIVVLKIDYDNLWLVFFIDLLPHANEMVGF